VIQNIDQFEEEESDSEDGENEEDEEMEGSDDTNTDEKSDDGSDIEMDDALADKEFAKEIPPEVLLSETPRYHFLADKPQIILENKRNHPAFAGLLRSKGFFWLATRPDQHGEWSQAGGMLTLQGGGPWFAKVPRGASISSPRSSK